MDPNHIASLRSGAAAKAKRWADANASAARAALIYVCVAAGRALSWRAKKKKQNLRFFIFCSGFVFFEMILTKLCHNSTKFLALNFLNFVTLF